MSDRMDFNNYCRSHGYPKFIVSVAGLVVEIQTTQYRHGNYWKDEFWAGNQKVVELDQEVVDFVLEKNRLCGKEYKIVCAIVPRVPEGSVLKSDRILGYLAWSGKG